MPLTEDDAEVGGVPGEEHLEFWSVWGEIVGQRRGGWQTFMLHLGPWEGMSMPP